MARQMGKKATKDSRWLAESPCREVGCDVAWNYWCHRLMASENRGCGGNLAS